MHTSKAYGKSLKPADLPDGIARFFPVALNKPNAQHTVRDPLTQEEVLVGTGLPPDLLLSVLESLREDVAEIRQALSEVEVRMVGASLLVVYEADWDHMRESLQYWSEKDSEDESEDEGEDSDAEDQKKRPGPPYVVKLIDFAHTFVTPGEGPDQGVLFGLDTVLKLLAGRIEEVKNIGESET